MDGDSGEWQRGLTALWQYVAFRGTAAVPPRAVAVGVRWCVGRGPQAELLGRRPSSVLRPALESLPGWSWAGRSERRWPPATPQRCHRQRGGRPTPYRRMGHRAATGARRRHPTEAPHRATRRSARLAVERGPLTARSQLLSGPTWPSTRHSRTSTAPRSTASPSDWVKRCRDDYRSGSLNGWQIDDLESLPGWTWRGPDERWRRASPHSAPTTCATAARSHHEELS